MLIYFQLFWADNIRDIFFYKKYNSLDTNKIKELCKKIDNFFQKYTFIDIQKKCILEKIGYKKWRYINREDWKIKDFKPYRPLSYVWKSYFDESIGIVIDSSTKIKEIEKERGYTYITPNEHNEIVKKAKKANKEKRKTHLRKEIEQNLKDLEQGRSFAKELRKKLNG